MITVNVKTDVRRITANILRLSDHYLAILELAARWGRALNDCHRLKKAASTRDPNHRSAADMSAQVEVDRVAFALQEQLREAVGSWQSDEVEMDRLDAKGREQ